MKSNTIKTTDCSQYEIIPLGIDCGISHTLRNHGLRHKAFPFDWNITPMQSALALIRQDFEDFLNEDNLIFLPPVKRLLFDEEGSDLEMQNDIITPVLCQKYHILFPHDFSRHGREDLASVKRKYDRRIQRMRRLLRQQDIPVVFIANNNSPNEWQVDQYIAAKQVPPFNLFHDWQDALSTLLDAKYPQLPYTTCSLEEFLAKTINCI